MSNALLPDRVHALHARMRRRLLLAALGCTAMRAPAALPRLEDFTLQTWQSWQKSLPRPAIVVFSTTYCPTCPQVFNELAEAVRKSRSGVPLIAVVMDGESTAALPHLKHYRSADRIFVFRGAEAPLRFSVNPHWRGVTPYVALFRRQGETQLVAGKPADVDLQAVLGRQ